MDYIPVKERGGVLHPHLVILGAGASLAALPKGDAFGRQLPLLWNLAHVVGIADEVKRRGLGELVNDFEKLYSYIFDNQEYHDLTLLAEKKIQSYFGHLTLPEYPTVYDYLVLGLRKKDLIATFNWDPLLIEAYRRNHGAAKGRLPTICFLHGNVRAGACMEHRIKGIPGSPCPKCSMPLEPSKLLFPVEKKNYNEDHFIRSEWEQTKSCAKIAYIFTAFGYSAPKTDVEARSLLKEAWTSSKIQRQAEFEIIDIKSEEDLNLAWDEFKFSHHYRYQKNFKTSLIGKRPRRSCELLFSWLLDVQWTETKPYPDCGSLDELHSWIAPLIAEEESYDKGGELTLGQ